MDFQCPDKETRCWQENGNGKREAIRCYFDVNTQYRMTQWNPEHQYGQIEHAF